tara:strand:+ start:355 stop:774 length:420 start_codon:yes stop_codon:yes gene_type:complete
MKDRIRKILTEHSEVRVKSEIKIPKSIHRIHEIFKKEGFKLYLVGGAIRDTLTGRHPKDFDLATDATPNKVKKMLPMYPTIESGEQFAVVNVVTDDDTYEIATFREDISYGKKDLNSFLEYLKNTDITKYEYLQKELMK